MDPLGAASAIAPLVVKAFTLSQQVYTTISQITNAPKHIKAISNDPEDFYIVLGTLKGYLEDEDLSQCVLHPSTSDNLESVLENSVNIFTELSGIILRSIKYTFISAEVDSMRAHLAAPKLTLNMAISLANYLNLQTVNASASRIEVEISAHMRELEDKLPLISQQVKDLQVAELPQGSPHSLTDRKLLLYDHDYTLRKYFESAASIISSWAPSMRISSLGSRERSSAPTSSAYRTAQSHITKPRGPLVTIQESCSQIFVKGFRDTSISLQVDPSMKIERVIQALFNGHYGSNLPHDNLLDVHRKFLELGKLLSDYEIPHNATFFCHFRIRETASDLIVTYESQNGLLEVR